MTTALERLGRLAARRRWAVLGAWLALLVGVAVLAQASGGHTIDDFTVPGTQSQQSTTFLQRRLPAYAGAQTQVIFLAPAGQRITATGQRTRIERTLTRLRHVPQVALVSDPFQTKVISKDGRAALTEVQYTVAQARVNDTTLDDLNRAVAPLRSAGVRVEFAGSVFPGSQFKLSEIPEIAGVVIGLVILLITFGALIAAGVPILVALIGVGVGLMAVMSVASVVHVASTATSLAIMLGLACGIDY